MAKQKAKRLPTWATDFFEASLDRQQQLMDVIEISAVGIAGLKGMPRLIEVLAEVKDQEAESYTKRLELAKRRAALAHSEEEANFSTLHGFGTMAIWSWLESFVIDLAVLWVAKRPSSLKGVESVKVKVSVADMVKLKGTDKARYLVEQLDREASGPLRSGFNRFEQLLKAVGLAVNLPKEHRDTLFELQKVRNCLAHRHGYADQKLKSECPWLDVKVGRPVEVTRAMMSSYGVASTNLLLECIYSAGKQYGIDVKERVERRNREAGNDRSKT